jgi:sec-independent protein translocase protein TatA
MRRACYNLCQDKTKKEEGMFGQLGPWELLLILVIVLLIFGVGRVSKIGRELGEGIREFREGLTGEESETEEQETKDKTG